MDTDQRRRIVEMLRKGYSYERIAKCEGVGNGSISKIKKEEGIVVKSAKAEKKERVSWEKDIAPKIDALIGKAEDAGLLKEPEITIEDVAKIVEIEEGINVEESDDADVRIANERFEQAMKGSTLPPLSEQPVDESLLESAKRLMEFGRIMKKPIQLDLSGKPTQNPTTKVMSKPLGTTFSFDEKLDILDAIKSQMVGCKASHWGELAEKWKKFMQE